MPLYVVTHVSVVTAADEEEAKEQALAQAVSDRRCFIAIDVSEINQGD